MFNSDFSVIADVISKLQAVRSDLVKFISEELEMEVDMDLKVSLRNGVVRVLNFAVSVGSLLIV